MHDQYHELFDREVAYIRANQNYAQSRYQQERDKLVESTVGELDLLKAQLRTKLQNKLEILDQAARTARKIAIATTLVVLVLGILISLKVSRSMSDLAHHPPELTVVGHAVHALALPHRSSSHLSHVHRCRY